MTDTRSLKKYQSKRHFKKTDEPKGKVEKRSSPYPIFVVQKHDASQLHYDFRLEIGGVLVSWAVPKGISTDPSDKRLAISTEDHPLEYAEFEGTIPKDEYGGGTVMIWDKGTYENMKKEDDKKMPMETCLKKGRIEISLEGKKLKGGYVLVRMENSKDKHWLLIKMRDDYADKKIKNATKSAVTGRTMKQIAEEGEESE